MKSANEYPKPYARIGAVLALLGTAIWVQWPLDFAKINITGAVFFVAAFITWIGIERAEYEGSHEAAKLDAIHSEDASKLNRILTYINKNQFYVLRHHAIETYIAERNYSGLEDILYYKENDIFPFHSKDIQTKYENFCALTEKFIEGLYGLYTSDGRGSMTWRSRRDDWVSDEVYKKVMTQIARLNREASALASSWEDLIATARAELKGASTPIEHYDL